MHRRPRPTGRCFDARASEWFPKGSPKGTRPSPSCHTVIRPKSYDRKKRGGSKRSAADGLFNFVERHQSLGHELIARLAQPPEGLLIQRLRDLLDGGRAADRLPQGLVY